MMKKYEFKLPAAYSLYRGVYVLWQRGAVVMFLADETVSKRVRALLRKSFEDYVRFVRSRDDCPADFLDECRVLFMNANRFSRRKFVFGLRFRKSEDAYGFAK